MPEPGEVDTMQFFCKSIKKAGPRSIIRFYNLSGQCYEIATPRCAPVEDTPVIERNVFEFQFYHQADLSPGQLGGKLERYHCAVHIM